MSNRGSSYAKNSEISELKADLICDKPYRRKEAVKKIISSMTSGKDVSSLFVDVLNCSQTPDLELKKLVYLYLLTYSNSNPDMAIMAVNSFVKDTNEPFPLVRALAIRTMACMDVNCVTEYLCEPLRKCLRDTDPYVRKTAVLCIGKLHKLNPRLVEDRGFSNVKTYLSDSNSMVVANAVATISEMQEISLGKPADISKNELNLLMNALNDCSEWGQITILDYIAAYEPGNEKEAKTICERVTQRLSHSNAGVVLSTIKVMMRMMDRLTDDEFLGVCDKKLSNPLITMLSAPPEIQYVALRNISLILQKRPNILRNEVTNFYVKYNDELYVKLEKLDIMTRLTNIDNISRVLPELKEYATGIDIDFVRRSVRAIGYCAIKIPDVAERCVLTLHELVKTKVDYIIQEAIVVIRDIFRKYPNKYESIIGTFCSNFDSLDEPESRAALIWIVGEYADRIDNADELLGSFIDNFHDESTQVQLQLLTSVVKFYLKNTGNGQDLVEKILDLCTKESGNPDLRDRGFIYWRLLSSDPVAAKEIVLGAKPSISEKIDSLEPNLLNEMIKHIGSMSSISHKPPSFSYGPQKEVTTVFKAHNQEAMSNDFMEVQAGKPTLNLLDDLLCFDDQFLITDNSQKPTELTTDSFLDDSLFFDKKPNPDFSLFSEPPGYSVTDPMTLLSQPAPLETNSQWTSKVTSDNIQMAVSWKRGNSISVYVDIAGVQGQHLAVTNVSISQNSFGLFVPSQPQIVTKNQNRVSFEAEVKFQQSSVLNSPTLIFPNFVVSLNQGTLQTAVHGAVLFNPSGQLSQFQESWWDNVQATHKTVISLPVPFSDEVNLTEGLRKLNIFNMFKSCDEGGDVFHFAMKFDNSALALGRLAVSFSEGRCTLDVICPNPNVRDIVGNSFKSIFASPV